MHGEPGWVWVLGLTLLVAGVVLIVVGRKQKAGTLPRNWIAGLRTSETMRNDDAWYAAHTATAGMVTGAGVVQVVAGAALVVLQPREAVMAAIVLGGTGLTLALVLAAGSVDTGSPRGSTRDTTPRLNERSQHVAGLTPAWDRGSRRGGATAQILVAHPPATVARVTLTNSIVDDTAAGHRRDRARLAPGRGALPDRVGAQGPVTALDDGGGAAAGALALGGSAHPRGWRPFTPLECPDALVEALLTGRSEGDA